MRWFPNRWPAMPDERCEVILYTPDHDATFWSLGPDAVRKVVDLWAERSERLGAREDISYVLVFENRGAEVGATITHPHGQIYAFDFVPEAPLRELEHGSAVRRPRRAARSDERRLARVGSRRAGVSVRPASRARRAGSRPAIARRRRPSRSGGDPGRRPRTTRSNVRRSDAVHALDPPATVRRWRVAGRAAARRDRLALARPPRAPVTSPPGSSARVSTSIRWRPRQPRSRCARRREPSMTTALDRLLFSRRAAELGVSGAPEPEPTACAGDARLVPDTGGRGSPSPARRPCGGRSTACGSSGSSTGRPLRQPRPGRVAAGTGSTCPVCGRCRGTSSRTTRTS